MGKKRKKGNLTAGTGGLKGVDQHVPSQLPSSTSLPAKELGRKQVAGTKRGGSAQHQTQDVHRTTSSSPRVPSAASSVPEGWGTVSSETSEETPRQKGTAEPYTFWTTSLPQRCEGFRLFLLFHQSHQFPPLGTNSQILLRGNKTKF